MTHLLQCLCIVIYSNDQRYALAQRRGVDREMQRVEEERLWHWKGQAQQDEAKEISGARGCADHTLVVRSTRINTLTVSECNFHGPSSQRNSYLSVCYRPLKDLFPSPALCSLKTVGVRFHRCRIRRYGILFLNKKLLNRKFLRRFITVRIHNVRFSLYYLNNFPK